MSTITTLEERVMAAQKRDGLPDDHPMVVAAEKFSAAARGFFADPQTVSIGKFMGTFARARKLWCEYSGEPLV